MQSQDCQSQTTFMHQINSNKVCSITVKSYKICREINILISIKPSSFSLSQTLASFSNPSLHQCSCRGFCRLLYQWKALNFVIFFALLLVLSVYSLFFPQIVRSVSPSCCDGCIHQYDGSIYSRHESLDFMVSFEVWRHGKSYLLVEDQEYQDEGQISIYYKIKHKRCYVIEFHL